MSVFLLIIIVAILLFGAGVVKGWLQGALAVALGLFLLCAFAILIAEVFGQTAFWVLFFGLGILLFIGSLWARNQEN